MPDRQDRHGLAAAAPVHVGIAGHGGFAAVVAPDDQLASVGVDLAPPGELRRTLPPAPRTTTARSSRLPGSLAVTTRRIVSLGLDQAAFSPSRFTSPTSPCRLPSSAG